MTNRKIALITLARDPDRLRELALSVQRLRLPEGILLEHLVKFGACSVTTGYNALMSSSDAEYKVYIHDDCVLNEPEFLIRLIEAFSAFPETGIIGVCGAKHLPSSAVWWEAKEKYGRVVDTHLGGELKFRAPAALIEEVEVLDGLVLCTRRDIPWDERLDGFHFYDASQCIRFRREGWRAGVLRQSSPYLTHAGSVGFDAKAYDRARRRFLALYPDVARKAGSPEDPGRGLPGRRC